MIHSPKLHHKIYQWISGMMIQAHLNQQLETSNGMWGHRHKSMAFFLWSHEQHMVVILCNHQTWQKTHGEQLLTFLQNQDEQLKNMVLHASLENVECSAHKTPTNTKEECDNDVTVTSGHTACGTEVHCSSMSQGLAVASTHTWQTFLCGCNLLQGPVSCACAPAHFFQQEIHQKSCNSGKLCFEFCTLKEGWKKKVANLHTDLFKGTTSRITHQKDSCGWAGQTRDDLENFNPDDFLKLDGQLIN